MARSGDALIFEKNINHMEEVKYSKAKLQP